MKRKNELLTTKELASALKVSTRTLSNWRDERKITPLIIGKTVRFQWHKVIDELQKISDSSEANKK